MAWENLPSTNTPLNATNLNKIIESSSNSNGSYIKTEDGDLIQRGTIECAANSNYGDITYPMAFINTDYTLLANTKYTGGSGYGGSAQLRTITTPQGYSTTAGYVYNVYHDETKPTFPRNVNWIAIGKWK